MKIKLGTIYKARGGTAFIYFVRYQGKLKKVSYFGRESYANRGDVLEVNITENIVETKGGSCPGRFGPHESAAKGSHRFRRGIWRTNRRWGLRTSNLASY